MDIIQKIKQKKELADIDDTFVVKSLTWKYPDMKTEVLVGEYRFDDLEYEKSIIEKLHDLESALTEIKDIKCSEQLEEVIVISDSTNVICAVSDGIVFVQSLSLGSSFTITTVSPAIYGSSTSKYNDVVVYGTVQVISGFVPSGFTGAGFRV